LAEEREMVVPSNGKSEKRRPSVSQEQERIMAVKEIQSGRDTEILDLTDLEELRVQKRARERLFAQLHLLLAQRRFLSRFVAVGFLVITAIAFLIPKRYESWTQLMPPDSQSINGLAMMAATSAPGAIGSLAGDLLGMKTTGALFVGVMRSHALEYRIIDRFDLKKVYGARLNKDARDILTERTSINEDRKSGIITLTVMDRDPQRAAAIARGYVEELNAMMAQLSTSSAHRERVFLEERLADVKQDLELAEKDLSEYSSKNSTVDIGEQAKAMVESAATLQGQLVAAQSELEGLKQIYTGKFPRVRALQARIDELHRELNREMSSTDSGKTAGTIGNNVSEGISYPSLRQLPLLGVSYADKLRRSKVEEAVYETLTKEYEVAKVQEAKEIPTVKVLDPPEVPEQKSYPRRLLIMFCGTIGFMIAGVVWVLGTAHWQSIDPEHPVKLFVQEFSGVLKQGLVRISPNLFQASGVARGLRERNGDGDIDSHI
jgi:capsule polysaccharide export protein KpsE/RkpR